ncbi:hypothetical protein VNO77_37292 [Canavalia gladiata]|uniref:Uncharacterized protein n=1 Tax=Canavalia gladiata TaxID=3824 RepID=A0AAN9K8S8_CANGL
MIVRTELWVAAELRFFMGLHYCLEQLQPRDYALCTTIIPLLSAPRDSKSHNITRCELQGPWHRFWSAEALLTICVRSTNVHIPCLHVMACIEVAWNYGKYVGSEGKSCKWPCKLWATLTTREGHAHVFPMSESKHEQRLGHAAT